MAEMTKQEMLRIVDENIARLSDKNFNLYFFVLDTKGNPSSALEYIYQTALVLNKKGYKVTMLHQENDFVGVGDWLGEEYANLPHANIEKDNVEIRPSGFSFYSGNICKCDASNEKTSLQESYYCTEQQ